MTQSNTEFMTDIEAAKWLNASVFTLRAWRCKGEGPVYRKWGRAVRYSLEDLKEYAEKQRVAPAN